VRYGIDFGGSKCCTAACGPDGAPRLIAMRGGERLLPSVVAYERPGPDATVAPASIGASARQRGLGDRLRGSVAGVKRLFGRRIDDVELRRPGPWLGGGLVPADNGDAWIDIWGRPLSPPALAAPLFGEIAASIEKELPGGEQHEAVIAVPPGFEHAARQALKDAAELGGVRVARLLSSACAAVLGHNPASARRSRVRLAVVDLGATRLDVSILAIEHGVLEVLATAGESVGGDDFDRRIVARLAAEARAAHGVDLEADAVVYARFLEEAQRLKHQCNDAGQGVIQIPGHEVPFTRAVRRAEVEAWTRDLVDRIEEPCLEALSAAGVTLGSKPGDLREVLVVGGASRFAPTLRKLEQIFGCPPTRAGNPEEVVALGAAVYAAMLDGLPGSEAPALALDVNPHAIGVRAPSGTTTVVPRFSTLPARGERVITTQRDRQTEIAIDLVEGSAERPLARYRISGLPDALAGEPLLLVDFTVDSDGLVALEARPLAGGARPTIRREAATGLTRAELRREREHA
jgi:molecular chaperone DnaK